MKKTALHITRALVELGEDVSCLATESVAGIRTARVRYDRLFVNTTIRRSLFAVRPDLVLYLPHSSDTLPAFLRARRLKHLTGAKVALLSTQPREHPSWTTPLLRMWHPDHLFVTSRSRQDYYLAKGVLATRVPLAGVDPDEFFPLGDDDERRRLRRKYNLPVDRQVLLHVGHCKASRNLDTLVQLKTKDNEVVFVASTSTTFDPAVAAMLVAGGVRVIRRFLPAIRELYQVSDLYVFPVERPDGAIEFPLSVLEALACGSPVVSTRFGCLPEYFPECDALRYFSSRHEAPAAAATVSATSGASARRLALQYSWQNVARDLFASCVGQH